jgi:hypothetical protein
MTEIRESPRELLALACAMRQDWTTEETWTAILACKTAGFEWSRIVRKLVDLALKDEEGPPTRPGELWDAVRGIKSLPGTGAPLDPAVKAELFGRLAAVSDARNSATGPQPMLRQTGEIEFLREGPDP